MEKLFQFILITFLSFKIHAQTGCSPSFSKDSFQIEFKKIKAHEFEDSKKDAIGTLLNKCLTSNQLKDLLNELSFEHDKLELAKKAFNQVSDPDKFSIIKDVFDFDETKKEIDILIAKDSL
jgi:hypothetical protein